MSDEMWDSTDAPITCDSCGEECEGTSECNNCSATLCDQCAGEYPNACGICYDEATAEDES